MLLVAFPEACYGKCEVVENGSELYGMTPWCWSLGYFYQDNGLCNISPTSDAETSH